MRLPTIACAVLSAAVLLQAAKEDGRVQTEGNKKLSIEATLYNDPKAVEKLLGDDLGGEYIVVAVKLTPKAEDPIPVYFDDFTLFSGKNGEKAWPFTPDQVAGGSALVLGQKGGGQGVMMDDQGPAWGGIGGPPSRLGGNGSSWGNSGSNSTLTGEVKSGETNETRLELIKSKALAEGKIDEPIQGLLFFPMNGKHKPKDLQLFYKGAAGKIYLEFK